MIFESGGAIFTRRVPWRFHSFGRCECGARTQPTNGRSSQSAQDTHDNHITSLTLTHRFPAAASSNYSSCLSIYVSMAFQNSRNLRTGFLTSVSISNVITLIRVEEKVGDRQLWDKYVGFAIQMKFERLKVSARLPNEYKSTSAVVVVEQLLGVVFDS